MSISKVLFLLVFSISSTVLADETVQYQKNLSKLKPLERYLQLQKDLSPKTKISLAQVDNWERGNQFTKCLQDESQFLEIEQGLLAPWEYSWRKRDEKTFNDFLFGSDSFNYPPRSGFIKLQSKSGITLLGLRKNGDSATSWKDSILSSYSNIDSVELTGLKYLVDPKFRDRNSLNFKTTNLTVHYDIRGVSKAGKRMNDRGELIARLVLANGKWKIQNTKVIDAERVVSDRAPAFIDQTKLYGLSDIKVYERSEAIRRGGYALAVKDINNDGIPDLFTGSAKESQLFLSQKNGKWKNASDSNLTKFSAVKTAVFSDFDNDGNTDAILTLFEYDRDDSDLAFLKNVKGKFIQQKAFVKGKLQYNLPMPASVADFNRDGFLDLYVGFPGKRDFTVLAPNKEKGRYQYPQGLFLNIAKDDKEKTFVDSSKMIWAKKGLSKYTSLFPHSSIATDYDFDGDMDLLVVDDRSNLSPLYENIDGKKLSVINSDVKLENKGYGMGVAIGDLNNDGINEIAMTNVNFHSKQRFNSSCNSNWYFNFENDPGVKLFTSKKKSNSRSSFSNITKSSGLNFTGEGAAGIEFFDYNNDGLLDVYVAAGLWSGEKNEPKHDISSLFVRAVAAKKTYNDVLSPYRTYRDRDWSFISILRDADFKVSKSMAGYQRNRLFINLGNNNFTEVGYLENVDSINDGYVLATGDPNRDGKIDFFLRNGDPGTMKHSFPVVQYFENNLPINANSLTLELEGRNSNRDAIGSTVTVLTNEGQEIHRHLTANNGAAQSQPLLHFGLNKARSVKSVEIRWPSGKTQNFGPMKKGHYKITEGFEPRIASNF